MYVYVYVCVHVYVCVYVYMCAYICTYTYRYTCSYVNRHDDDPIYIIFAHAIWML